MQTKTHRVLVVEDEEDLRDMIREVLEGEGYVVATAADGREAFDQIAVSGQLDCVLLDLVMPGMDGWEFLERFRQRPELESVPVIVHSSMRNPVPPGASSLLQKPSTFEQILASVQAHCSS